MTENQPKMPLILLGETRENYFVLTGLGSSTTTFRPME